MTEDNRQSKTTEGQKLIAVVITLFALAFIAAQIADIVDAVEADKTPQIILRSMAVVAGAAATAWAWLRFREKA